MLPANQIGIPYEIEPRPDIRALKERLFNMTAKRIKEEVLPIFMDRGIIFIETSAYNKVASLSVENLKQRV